MYVHRAASNQKRSPIPGMSTVWSGIASSLTSPIGNMASPSPEIKRKNAPRALQALNHSASNHRNPPTTGGQKVVYSRPTASPCLGDATPRAQHLPLGYPFSPQTPAEDAQTFGNARANGKEITTAAPRLTMQNIATTFERASARAEAANATTNAPRLTLKSITATFERAAAQAAAAGAVIEAQRVMECAVGTMVLEHAQAELARKEHDMLNLISLNSLEGYESTLHAESADSLKSLEGLSLAELHGDEAYVDALNKEEEEEEEEEEAQRLYELLVESRPAPSLPQLALPVRQHAGSQRAPLFAPLAVLIASILLTAVSAVALFFPPPPLGPPWHRSLTSPTLRIETGAPRKDWASQAHLRTKALLDEWCW